jgi:hypothetical protein
VSMNGPAKGRWSFGQFTMEEPKTCPNLNFAYHKNLYESTTFAYILYLVIKFNVES